MTNFVNRLCLKIIYFHYILGKCLGIVTATYYPAVNKVKRSKRLTKIFAGLRTVIALVLMIIVASITARHNLKFDSVTMPFVLQTAFILSTTMFLVVAQIKHADELIGVINEFMALELELKSKRGVNERFGNKFFVILLVKMITTTCLCFCDMPLLFQIRNSLTLLLFIAQMFIWSGTLVFFNFAFIGLMMSSAFQDNMFEYLENCWKLKELEEFSLLSLRFYKIFGNFLGLVRTHLLMALIFYTLTTGAGLTMTISIRHKDTYVFVHAVVYYTFCMVDVLLFNMAADLIERNSRKRIFCKVDLLTNDTKQVKGSLLLTKSIIELIIFFSRWTSFSTN